jgi:cytoskeletal protein CcmA (bactofilin family)
MFLENTMKVNYFTKIGCVTLLALSTSGCIIHVGGHDEDNHHHVMGDIDVDAGSQMEDVSTVNGDISLNNGVSAETVDTVNGDIALGRDISIFSASSVNGDISAGTQLTVRDDISTVNGDIDLKARSTVGGDISTVNGDISLEDVKVSGGLETKNGDISLLKGSAVSGDIIYQSIDKSRWSNHDLPTLRIDAQSTILGKIILNRKVILEIDNADILSQVERNYGQ